jgi:hypothetical protein
VTIQEFVDQFEGFTGWDGRKQVDYLAYFLIAVVGQPSFSAREMTESFDILSMKPYSRIAPYLSENATRGRGGKYIKIGKEYGLERSVLENIRKHVEDEPKRIQVSQQLSGLISRVRDSQEHAFLKEAIDCYRVRAFRATIVMVWILVVHHLEKFIHNDSSMLSKFNAALAKNPDRKVKVICKAEDFSELSEVKLIELMRAADLISNDTRKLLDEKLGIRNSAAHPSDLVFDGHKATEFSSDLIQNVLLKF